MVKVSVIMPVFNGENYLEKSFESLFNQTLKDIELICVDDGSTDNSLEKLYSLKEKYQLVKIFEQENQGSGKARNYGMDKAIGEYIAFLDADDIFVDNDALEKMYEFGEKNNADIVCGNLKRVSLEGELEDNFNYKDGNYRYFSKYEVIKPKDYGVPWAFYKNIFKTEFLNEFNIRFPDLKRGQDPVLMAKALTKVDEIVGVPVDLYGYNYAAGGGANSKVDDYTKKVDYIKHFKETFKVLEEGGLSNLSNKYKEKLALYLKLNRNRNDQELHDIVWEIFVENNYYDKYKERLFNLRTPKIIEEYDTTNSEETYKTVKNGFYNMNFVGNYFISYEMMDKYLGLSQTVSNTDDKTTIEKINNTLQNRREELSIQKEELINKCDNLTEINKDLDSPFPSYILDDSISYGYNKKIESLQDRLLDIVLDPEQTIPYELIEEYNSLRDLSDFTRNSKYIENQNHKINSENEQMQMKTEYLNKELSELKLNQK